MQTIKNAADYTPIEQDLCKLHEVEESDTLIGLEYRQIQDSFQNAFPNLVLNDDFEFPDWHHNLRMLWVYLYSDDFYTAEFIPTMSSLLNKMNRPWFAQFECSAPSLESSENVQGFIGWFLIYKESVIFSDSEKWAPYQVKLGV